MKKNILGVDVKKILKEETIVESSLGRIPDFKIDDAVDQCINALSLHVKSYILQDKSRDPIELNMAVNDAKIVLKEISEEMKEMIKEKLFGFSQR